MHRIMFTALNTAVVSSQQTKNDLSARTSRTRCKQDENSESSSVTYTWIVFFFFIQRTRCVWMAIKETNIWKQHEMKGVFSAKTPLLEWVFTLLQGALQFFVFIARELLPPPNWNPIHSVRMWKKNLFSKLSKVMIFLLQHFTLFTYSCCFFYGVHPPNTRLPAEYLTEVPVAVTLCCKIHKGRTSLISGGGRPARIRPLTPYAVQNPFINHPCQGHATRSHVLTGDY